VIEQGDYLDTLAHRFGFRASEVWQSSENAALRAKRKPEQLHPGDVLHIPTDPPKWLPVTPSTTNGYSAAVPRVPLRLTFETAEDGKPCAGEACVVEGLGAPLEAQTDGSGLLELAVPVTVRELTIRFVKRNVRHHVHVGGMDPIDEDSGVAKRLAHLMLLGPHQMDDAEAVADALRRFQRRQQLPETGTLDDATKAALLRVHGS
jgi:N-acetylmuramoyl-L-alanine amidase